MIRYILNRILLMIPTLLGISLVVLLFITITPGDPARLMGGNDLSEEEIEEIRVELGLRDPFIVRYFNFITGVIRGDFGKSFRTKRPVIDEIKQRFPYSLLLVVLMLPIALLIGVPTGIYAATHQYTWKDNFAIFASLFCVSMPGFWFSLMLIQLLCVKMRVLPASGVDSWQGWILPAFTGSLGFAATIARQTRSNLLEVIRQDYITTARAKGQTERVVLYRHALKNAIIPVVMIIGGIFGMAMGGSMISEVIFSIPGLGLYTLGGLNSRDYPVIQTCVFLMSGMLAIVLLLVDLAFGVIDPRIRSQYSRKKRKVAKEAASE